MSICIFDILKLTIWPYNIALLSFCDLDSLVIVREKTSLLPDAASVSLSVSIDHLQCQTAQQVVE